MVSRQCWSISEHEVDFAAGLRGAWQGAAPSVSNRFAHARVRSNRAALLFKDTYVSEARHPRGSVAKASGAYLVGRGGVCV